jgi:predicted nucleic acid-binding Zn ribbon protein
MPLYTFSCPKCTGVYETIMSYDKMKTSEVMCKPCQVDMKRDITMPSKTASAWGDQGCC